MVLIFWSLADAEKNTNDISSSFLIVRVFDGLFVKQRGKQQLEHRALCMRELKPRTWKVRS